MTLESIYYIGQTVAVVIIIATLIALLYQSRQANRLARADMTQASWGTILVTQAQMYSTPESADLMQRGLYGAAPLTDAEKLRFSINMSNMLSAVESGDLLWRQGLFDETSHQRILRSMAVYFESPRVRKWWTRARKDRFVHPFSEVIDEIASRAEGKSRPAKAGEPPS
ncbi:MAG: hypothetical protein COA85_11110 [Robiginitomaculum sp.]|nr:MAG: hypothetical protein COA85_11110 [Robiginitomaculum sp.]